MFASLICNKYLYAQKFIRTATPSDMEWINKCYDEVKFVHSDYNNETIAIFEYNENKAGIGRMVTIDQNNLELGGMYVFHGYRNKGIARDLVEYMIKTTDVSKNIYCIPFVKYEHFYRSCGFTDVKDWEAVPNKLKQKLDWCNSFYGEPLSLLKLKL
jgi:N-acetylglutamate synthase-like GNAT family acetyltransferase